MMLGVESIGVIDSRSDVMNTYLDDDVGKTAGGLFLFRQIMIVGCMLSVSAICDAG